MVRQLIIMTLVVGIGLAIGAFTGSRLQADADLTGDLSKLSPQNMADQLANASKSGELDSDQVAQVVESLIQVLDQEINERRVLEKQLNEMQANVDDLQRLLGYQANSNVAPDFSGPTPEEVRAQAEQSAEERLSAAGFSPRQVEVLRRREAEAAMQQIALDDRARREGWINSPRYFEEANKLASAPDAIRAELGDDAYDRYLFAGGNPNRITVSNVIETSPAQQAGLRAGDVIKTYGGERVFSARQLVELRSAGASGQSVTVEVIRDGQLVHITMPRGPMGVQTRPDIVDPNATGGG